MSRNSIFDRYVFRPHPEGKVKYDCEICAANVKKIFTDCGDFELREVWPGDRRVDGVSVCWIDGVVSGTTVSEDVLRPLTDSFRLGGVKSAADCARALCMGAVYSYSVKQAQTMDELVYNLVHGFCAVLFEREKSAVCFETKTGQTRSVSAPTVEKAVKGAKDAFVETIRVNTSLVRRKLRDPALKVVQKDVGRRTSTQVAVMYLKGIANEGILAEVERRIDAIDIDGLTSAGSIEQYITDAPRSVFPQLLHTERPDKFASELLSGRIGILADGLPIGFLAPASLPQFMRVGEDRAQHFLTASLLMLIRWLSFTLAILLPAVLVAVAMYHPEMIPDQLLSSMIAAKQDVPFSVAIEVLSMLVAFELLQEAGVRLPDPIGNTVSIIGALIVGQSAVDAKVISPIAVIVVATAGICGYTQPSQDVGSALRIIRIVMVLLAITLGMFGLMLGITLLLWRLNTIESFGISYTSPLSDGGVVGFLCAFITLPLWRNKYRPASLKTGDKRNQK